MSMIWTKGWRQICFFLVFLLLAAWPGKISAHAFYVSMCQIQQETSTDSIRVIVTVFSDDLALAISTAAGESGKSLQEMMDFSGEEAISYISSRLSIKADRNELDFAIHPVVKIGQTRTKLTFIFPARQKIEQFQLSNRIFFELFEDQQNMVRITVNGQKKSAIFEKATPDGIITLD